VLIHQFAAFDSLIDWKLATNALDFIHSVIEKSRTLNTSPPSTLLELDSDSWVCEVRRIQTFREVHLVAV